MQLHVQELKAVAVVEDLTENDILSVTRSQCMTVEHFEYQCSRKRDERGHAFGMNLPVMFSFTVRINNKDQARPLYHLLKENTEGYLSFIFNARYGANQRLTEYEEAMTVEGFVVEIEEDFKSAAADEAESEEQIVLRARMQARSITYIGNENKRTLTFLRY